MNFVPSDLAVAFKRPRRLQRALDANKGPFPGSAETSTMAKSVLLVLCMAVAAAVGQPVVETKLGRISGTLMQSRKGAQFYAFRGIPYAQPPLGELRFRSPRPVEPWHSTLEALDDKPPCIQLDWIFKTHPEPEGNEDCLYLNVYTPTLHTNASDLMDVFFYIHGGGWLSGTGASTYYGPHYLMDRNVVLVTIQYRLGALGFLSTEDRASPGNYGMKDQVAALRWVRDNIEAFGGNPGRVTIFGQSAGGASTHYHVISPSSAGLFHQAVLHSGNALEPWATARNARQVAKRQAEAVGCPSESTYALVKCLRTKDAADIVRSFLSLTKWNVDPLLIFSIVPERETYPGEDVFLPEEPYRMLQKGEYNKVPVMAGLTSDDGAFRTAMLMAVPGLIDEMGKDFERIGPIVLRYEETAVDAQEVTRKIRSFYFGDRPITSASTGNITKMFTDRLILADLVEALNLMASHHVAPVYFYQFSYRGQHSFTQPLAHTDQDMGVSHLDEILYLFTSHAFFPSVEPGTEDDKMVDTLLDIWTNFGRTGNPTPKNEPVHWPEFTAEGRCYLDIGAQSKVHCGGLHNQRVAFWNNLYLKENGNKLRCKDEL